MAMSLAERMAPTHSALVVVDAQIDFGDPAGALGQLGADLSMAVGMAPRLRKLIAAARETEVRVIFTRYVARPSIYSETWFEKHPPNICGTERGASYLEGIGPEGEEDEVIKDRYSSFKNTDLDLLLRVAGTRTVVLAGIATNVCVETAAREAINHDYAPVLVHDCCAATSTAEHDAAVGNVERYFGWVADHQEVIDGWRGGGAPADALRESEHYMRQWDERRHGGVEPRSSGPGVRARG